MSRLPDIDPVSLDPEQRQVHDAILAGPRGIAALAELGRTGLIDLVGVLGYCGLISMTIQAFEIPVPAGVADPFPVA